MLLLLDILIIIIKNKNTTASLTPYTKRPIVIVTSFLYLKNKNTPASLNPYIKRPIVIVMQNALRKTGLPVTITIGPFLFIQSPCAYPV